MAQQARSSHSPLEVLVTAVVIAAFCVVVVFPLIDHGIDAVSDWFEDYMARKDANSCELVTDPTYQPSKCPGPAPNDNLDYEGEVTNPSG